MFNFLILRTKYFWTCINFMAPNQNRLIKLWIAAKWTLFRCDAWIIIQLIQMDYNMSSKLQNVTLLRRLEWKGYFSEITLHFRPHNSIHIIYYFITYSCTRFNSRIFNENATNSLKIWCIVKKQPTFVYNTETPVFTSTGVIERALLS